MGKGRRGVFVGYGHLIALVPIIVTMKPFLVTAYEAETYISVLIPTELSSMHNYSNNLQDTLFVHNSRA